MASSAALSWCSACFLIILAVGLGLFGGSFSVVNINHAGLLKNKLSVTIQANTIYKPGTYFVGLSGTFIQYPTTFQRIKFSTDNDTDAPLINVKSSNSTQFQVGLTLYYRFKIEFLQNLFNKYPSQNQINDMMTNAQQVIQIICSNNTLDLFFTNREQIASVMSYQISSIFKSQFFSEVTVFLLGDIVLNDQFEQSILNSQISARQALTQTYNQSIQNLSQAINNINSTAQIQINSILATAQVTSAQITSTNSSAGDALVYQATVTAMNLFTATPLSFNATQVTQLFYLYEVGALSSSTIYAGFTNQGVIFKS